MKKITALILMLTSLLWCVISCKAIPSGTLPNATKTDTEKPSYAKPTDMEDKFVKSEVSVLYNGFYYYHGRVDPEDFRSDVTYKVQNLRNLQPIGAQLYNDPLGNEDPFRQNLPNSQILVDEDATEKNGGMPVVIVGIKYAKIDLEGNNRILLYKIVSYNTASGKLTTLAETVEELKAFYLYKDKLYCVGRTWDYTIPDEPDRIYNVLVMDKDGKNKEEYVLKEKNILPSLIGVYNEKLYYTQNHNILRSDLDFENSEIIIDDIKCNFTPVFAGGYMYYQGNLRDVDIDSYTVKNCFDILRRPLNDLQSKDSEELVLEGLHMFMRCQERNLYAYYKIDEAQLIDRDDEKIISRSCTHAFDIITGESELLFDFRNTNTNRSYFVSFLSKDLCIYSTYPSDDYDFDMAINRKTGEETYVAYNIFD